MNFFDRIRNTSTIMGVSFRLMYANKLFFLFPLLKGINAFVWFFVYGFVFLFNTVGPLYDYLEQHFAASATPLIIAVLVGGTYIALVLFFVVANYISIITSRVTMHILEQRSERLTKVCCISLRRAWTVVAWSSIQVLVLAIISIIKGGEDGKGNFLQQLFGDVLGAAWDIATFFMHPVLALETLGPIASIKKSFHVMKHSFGETVTASIGFGIVGVVISLPVMILASVYQSLGYEGPLPLSVWILLVPTLFALSCIPTVRTIFQTAVYAYTQGKPTGPFPEGLIKKSFVQKK